MAELDLQAGVNASGSTEAQQAYAYGASTYDAYAKAKAEGKSDAEAVGEVGGALGGAAACTATGAGVAVAGLCGTVGGILGGIVGKAFNDWFGSKDDQADSVCSAVWKQLDAMIAAAAQNGITVTKAQAQRWFADAATRAQLAQAQPGTVIIGEIGVAGTKVVIGGAGLLKPGTTFILTARGIPTDPPRVAGPPDRFGNATYPLTAAGLYPMIATFSPVGRCIFSGMRLTEIHSGLNKSVSIGLAAVAARISALQSQQATRRVVTLAVIGSAVGGALWWWRNRKAKRRG